MALQTSRGSASCAWCSERRRRGPGQLRAWQHGGRRSRLPPHCPLLPPLYPPQLSRCGRRLGPSKPQYTTSVDGVRSPSPLLCETYGAMVKNLRQVSSICHRTEQPFGRARLSPGPRVLEFEGSFKSVMVTWDRQCRGSHIAAAGRTRH